MFKVDDKVRLIEDYGNLKAGAEGRVTKVTSIEYEESGRKAKQMVSFQLGSAVSGSPYFTCFDFRLEKIKDFNLSTATDQELADEYRRGSVERLAIAQALRDRGYYFKCKSNGAALVFPGPEDVSIYKKETIEL